jgi:hypothetical protein
MTAETPAICEGGHSQNTESGLLRYHAERHRRRIRACLNGGSVRPRQACIPGFNAPPVDQLWTN